MIAARNVTPDQHQSSLFAADPDPKLVSTSAASDSAAAGISGGAVVPFITLPRLRAAASPGSAQARPSPAPARQQPVQGAPKPGAFGTSETGGMEGGAADRTLVRSTYQYVPVAAMEDVLALRMQQIHLHGHTLTADLAAIKASGQRHHVAKIARTVLTDAIEDMQFNKASPQVRRRLVKAAALILAAIDAEDAVAEAKAEAEQLHKDARHD